MAVLSPIQNEASFTTAWIQVRPFITQEFGERPDVYAQFGLKGHNGIDLRAKVGVPIFACMDGSISTMDEVGGYGLHIKQRNEKGLEAVYAHLSSLNVVKNQRVNMGDLIGWTGNTGFSTGPHLHFGLRLLKPTNKDIWTWEVLNYNNGYKGWFDPKNFIINWKGTFAENSL